MKTPFRNYPKGSFQPVDYFMLRTADIIRTNFDERWLKCYSGILTPMVDISLLLLLLLLSTYGDTKWVDVML